ncbi:MAG: hypothetical protein ACUVTM_01560 [Candidatus Bathyarchaeia archaeon]
MRFLMKLLILLVTVTMLMPIQTILAETRTPIMVGYSRNCLLPFLEGGTLVFELGETLWAMSPNRTVILTVTTPRGESEAIILPEGDPIIVRRFEPDDPEGFWILKVQDGGEMKVKLLSDSGGNTYVKYSLGPWLSATIEGSRDTVFLDVDQGMVLIIAGKKQSLSLAINETVQPGGVTVEFVYSGPVRYTGISGEAIYEMILDPVAARVQGELLGQRGRYTLRLKCPNLHEVGSDCIVPAREGPVIIRVKLSNRNQTEFRAYLLREIFSDYAGRYVSTFSRIDLKSSLTSNLKILTIDRGKVEVLEARPSIAAIKFTEARSNLAVSNVTVKSGVLETTSDGDTNYILLSSSEPLSNTGSESSTTILPIEVYVNGFYARSFQMEVKRGGVTEASLELYRLTLKVTSDEAESLEDVRLMIENRTFPSEVGCASYLLPKGIYRVWVSIGDMEGSSLIQLDRDVEVNILLRPPVRLDYWLKTLVVFQLITITVLSGLHMMFEGSNRSSGQDRRSVEE